MKAVGPWNSQITEKNIRDFISGVRFNSQALKLDGLSSNLTLPLISYVILGKLLNLSESPICREDYVGPHLKP
jgi:hypothetical protein